MSDGYERSDEPCVEYTPGVGGCAICGWAKDAHPPEEPSVLISAKALRVLLAAARCDYGESELIAGDAIEEAESALERYK